MDVPAIVFLVLVAALSIASVVGTIVAVVRHEDRRVPQRRGE